MAPASHPARAEVLVLVSRPPDPAPASGPLLRLCLPTRTLLDACWAHSLLHFKSLQKRHRPTSLDHPDLSLQSLVTNPPSPFLGWFGSHLFTSIFC